MVWCGTCYQKAESDNFHVNKRVDDDGNIMSDISSDQDRYRIGIDGSQFMTPFQCDLCLFRNLFKRNPRPVISDSENLVIIRRLNLDSIWSREPSTIKNNVRSLGRLITTCEGSGFSPELPKLGPFPTKDESGVCVAFSMLIHSKRAGSHTKLYTQFETIRKQRSAFSNTYFASAESAALGTVLTAGDQSNGQITKCPTHSLWFSRWSKGCQTRMGFILKQNKALSLDVMLSLISEFKEGIENALPGSWDRQKLCMGLAYAVICFCASLRGNEGLIVDLSTLIKNLDRGNYEDSDAKAKSIPPHVIIPLRGRFKGETGERCHLMPLANKTSTGIDIRGAVNLLIAARKEMKCKSSPWAFVDENGNKLPFGSMNDIILDRLEALKFKDSELNKLGLEAFNIREDFSINRSFRRGSETHALNQKVPEVVINAQNRWKKIEAAKGRKAQFSMIENYADILLLIPTMVRYSAML
jgi:hypothetical protein